MDESTGGYNMAGWVGRCVVGYPGWVGERMDESMGECIAGWVGGSWGVPGGWVRGWTGG